MSDETTNAGVSGEQTALEVEGLVGPFYAVIYQHGNPERYEEFELSEVIAWARAAEETGQGWAQEIGDAAGWLWRWETPFVYHASERAPSDKPF